MNAIHPEEGILIATSPKTTAKFDLPTAPKSRTFRNTLNEGSPKATVPCRWIDDNQYVDVTAVLGTSAWSGEGNGTAPTGKIGAKARRRVRKVTTRARVEKMNMMMRYRLPRLEVSECRNLGKRCQ